jgi:hypothetical protein
MGKSILVAINHDPTRNSVESIIKKDVSVETLGTECKLKNIKEMLEKQSISAVILNEDYQTRGEGEEILRTLNEKRLPFYIMDGGVEDYDHLLKFGEQIKQYP